MNKAEIMRKSKITLRLVVFALMVISVSLLLLSTVSAEESSFDAEFGGNTYETLPEAITAANEAGGGEITLLRDVNLAECLTVSSNITLTGAYTVYRADTYTAGLFVVNAGATLTLDGGITIDGGNEWVLDEEQVKADWHDDATSGSYVTPETDAPIATAHMFSVAGNVVMNNATIQNHFSSGTTMYSVFSLTAPAVLTMNDGAKITHNCKFTNNVIVILPAGTEWIINEGAEVSHNFAKGNGALTTTNGNVTMNGGEIHHNINHTGSGSFLMMHGAGNLIINDCYVHHNLAFGGGWGCTIYIHSGSTGSMIMNDGLFEDNFSSRTSTIVKGGNKSTLKLNGGTIVQEQTDGYYKDKVNMTDYKDGYAGYYSGNVYFGEDMIVTGWRTYFSANAENNGRIETDVYLAGATTTCSGTGTVTGDVYVSGANAAINGGVWEGSFIVASGASLSITGGSFRENPSEWLSDSYGAIYNPETELYTVVETPKASVNGVEYDTAAEAVAAANAGDTVVIIASHQIEDSIIIDKDIIIDMNNQTVTVSDNVSEAFIILANVTLTGDGCIDADNGVTDVFMVGNDTTEGALTIANGRYVGENSVVKVANGSLRISGGEFAVNPDGEEPDYSNLIDIDVTDAEGTTQDVVINGGVFRRFNPSEIGTDGDDNGIVDDNLDSVENEDGSFSVIPHSFTNYVSNGDATCTEDGTKTAKCDNCDETHTVVDEGSAGHSFSVYISDQNSTCQSKGTKTAKCDRCDATDTQEGDKYGRHQYKGVKCQNCSRGQITQLIIIAMAIGVGGFAVWFMGFDRMFRPF